MRTTNSGAAAIPTDRYWASVERDELPQVLRAKAEKFRERLDREGRVEIWRRSERTYYGLDGEGGWANSVAVTYGGEEGELVVARVNHYRSIVQAVIAMVTASRPAFTALAINTDVESLTMAGLAKGVVEWAYRDKRIEDLRVEQVERAVVSGEAYLHLRWDTYAGRTVKGAEGQRPALDETGRPIIDEVTEPAQPETAAAESAEPYQNAAEEAGEIHAPPLGMNAPAPPSGMQAPPDALAALGAMTPAGIEYVTRQVPRMESYARREGDIAPEVVGPLQVVRDLDMPELKWCAVPHRENVWECIARYPQLKSHLLALRGAEQWSRRVWDNGVCTPEEGDDTIIVWCLYHLPTDALPEGRYALIAGDLVLHDEPWRFDDEIPVYDLVPQKQIDTQSGYSPMWDLLCLQELLDAVVTALATAHDAFGIQSIIAPKGTDISPEMLARGLQLLEWDPVAGAPESGRPTALSLLDIPQDSYKLLDIYQRTMETLSGVNSVARGDPQSNLKSGAALALVQSLSVHFNSTLQARVTRNDERVGTGILRLYRRFSPIPRLAEILGKRSKTKLVEFTAHDLEGVQRVHIELANPALRQGSGLLEIAFELLRAGVVKSTDEFFEILEAGRIEPLFEFQRDEMRLIRDENERLGGGMPVKIAPTDRDNVHILHHSRVFDDPDLRTNDSVLMAVIRHIDEHMNALNKKKIEMMWAIGQDIPPWRTPGPGGPPPAPGAAPVAPGEPAPTGAPPPGEGEAERAEVMGQPGPSDGPLMPTNPMTGERVPNGAAPPPVPPGA